MATATKKAAAPKALTPNDVKGEVAKMADIRRELNDPGNPFGLVEREPEILLVLLSLIAKEHCFFIGQRGVAKTQSVTHTLAHIEGVPYFETLLRKTTPVEELLGPVSLKGLEQDIFRYITTGKLPEALVAFLDEIFKANAVVLNAMLGIANERRFRNNGNVVQVPLWSMFGASNELPEDEELSAFKDRFASWKLVKEVEADDSFRTIMRGGIARRQLGKPRVEDAAAAGGIAFTKIDKAEVERLQEACDGVQVPEDVLNDITNLRRRAMQEGLHASSRRFISGLALCQAQAVLNGRDVVMSDDLTLFQYVLPNTLDDITTARELTLDYAGVVARKAAQLRAAYEPYKQELSAAVAAMDPAAEVTNELAAQMAKIQMNLRKTRNEVEKHLKEAQDEGRDTGELDALLLEIRESARVVKEDILGGDL